MCYSFQAWLDLMCWFFLSLCQMLKSMEDSSLGFCRVPISPLRSLPRLFSSLSLMEEAKVLGLSFLTTAAPAQLGKFSDDFKENRKGPRWLFLVSSGSDYGKLGAEPSCHLELLLPGQELSPPGFHLQGPQH